MHCDMAGAPLDLRAPKEEPRRGSCSVCYCISLRHLSEAEMTIRTESALRHPDLCQKALDFGTQSAGLGR